MSYEPKQESGVQLAPGFLQQPPNQQIYQQPLPNSNPRAYEQLPPTPQGYQQQHAMNPSYTEGTNVREQKWQNNLCNCSPCGSCLLGTFLPCMLLGKTSERMRDATLRTYEAFNTDCLLMCGITYFTGCGWIYAMIKRGEIRERFNIKGSGCGDCCTTYWCPCCALIQQDKEVQQRLASGPIVEGYQGNHDGMNMNQQF
ncbi:hypothetical protein ACHAQH_000725 [Verticillium albo-atrum]